MSATHDDMAELVAAYALDAVDPDEARLVEDHLRDCPRCRAELADHREAASFLAHTGGEAPAGLWERITGALGSAPDGAPPVSVVVGMRERRLRRPIGWAAGGLAAAAVAAIAVLGVGLARTEHRVGQLTSALAGQQALEHATAAALDPRARRLALTGPDGRALATAAVLPDGTAYVVPAGLRALASDRTYQVWSIVGGRAVSAGLMGPDPHVLAFRVPRGAGTLAITDEPAGGSPRPTTSPVASASV